MRVDIDLPEDFLKWAGEKAKELGMSRRSYMKNVLLRFSKYHDAIQSSEYAYPLTPDECTTTKPELDGYTVKKTHIGVMDAQQLRDKGVDVENLLEKGLLKKLE